MMIINGNDSDNENGGDSHQDNNSSWWEIDPIQNPFQLLGTTQNLTSHPKFACNIDS